MVTRRQKVKELSSERAAKLQASLAWQQFNRDADEVRMYDGARSIVCDYLN